MLIDIKIRSDKLWFMIIIVDDRLEVLWKLDVVTELRQSNFVLVVDPSLKYSSFRGTLILSLWIDRNLLLIFDILEHHDLVNLVLFLDREYLRDLLKL
jgi:hypothetical protein